MGGRPKLRAVPGESGESSLRCHVSGNAEIPEYAKARVAMQVFGGWSVAGVSTVMRMPSMRSSRIDDSAGAGPSATILVLAMVIPIRPGQGLMRRPAPTGTKNAGSRGTEEQALAGRRLGERWTTAAGFAGSQRATVNAAAATSGADFDAAATLQIMRLL